MPKRAKELSALEIKRLEYPHDEMQAKGNKMLPVFKAVGGVPGLQLQLTAGGGKSWIYRYGVNVDGKIKRRSLGLGSYPTYGVAEARDKAREAVRLLDQGEDPINARKATLHKLAAEASRPTFAQAIESWAVENPHQFTSAKYRKAWLNSLRAIKELQNIQVNQLNDRKIWDALEEDVQRSPDLGARVRGRIATVLRWAGGERYITGQNPADTDWIKAKVAAAVKGVEKQPMPSFPWELTPKWLVALRRINGMGGRALEFLLLTAVRSGDVRGMQWSEIDLAKAVWTIPQQRLKIKGKGDHDVPLSSAAMEVLKGLPRMAGVDLVFPATWGGLMSEGTMGKVMKSIHEKADGEGYVDKQSKRPATPHGLRSTFRTWAGEHSYPQELAELALAHTIGNEVQRAYERSTYIERRRPMMEAWATFVTGRSGSGTSMENHDG